MVLPGLVAHSGEEYYGRLTGRLNHGRLMPLTSKGDAKKGSEASRHAHQRAVPQHLALAAEHLPGQP